MFMQTCLVYLMKENLHTGNYWLLLDVFVGYVQEVQIEVFNVETNRLTSWTLYLCDFNITMQVQFCSQFFLIIQDIKP